MRFGVPLGVAVAIAAAVVGTEARAQTRVSVATIAGDTLAGELVGLDAAGNLVLRVEAAERSLPLDQLLEVRPETAQAVTSVGLSTAMLRSGQRLAVQVRGVTEDGRKLVLEVPPARAPIDLPVHALRALRLMPATAADAAGFAAAVADDGRRDLLFAKRGANDIVRLTVVFKRFEQIGDEVRAVVEFGGKEQPGQPLEKLYGLVFGQGAVPDPQAGPRATVHVAGGGNFTGALTGLDPAADRCALRLDEGATLDLPLRHVSRVTFRSDRLLYLSDLDPANVEQTPALARTWPWLRDRAPLGDDLRLGGKSHRRGLVLIPRTKLTYDIGGRFDWFETTIGIDDRAGDVADATIRVFGDGKLLFELEHLARKTPPQALRLAVKDVRALTLEADFGERLDLGDHCVFADARVRREG